MMSVDHSPSSLRRFTDQPLGFFSTAEGFVFVSAFWPAWSSANAPARVRRCSVLFDPPGRTHLPGTSVTLASPLFSALLLIRAARHQYLLTGI
jgi:hypothetical protein